mmetsp:Transcript_6704/g.8737  ORF Transcript_6704/g.8737 Transcript_6704/m.8737 type:complete len:602 (-) Transcript_6704:8-1813(-)|eukprot:CAMPEP_0184012984 /NCGR_PEP_ID=MMETSP0954-20121128/4755_1 /TAXON_ID=627963 /ORGANISM="Aplanochytrium sp, Strain PBS07" /LENGTH=601 /DNA_ID=CAMNT_0026293111 /DNA_START=79 /DNA_END=1884 /DNA_ORIENTATION=-
MSFLFKKISTSSVEQAAKKKYDFVVVGGGSAGAVVAARLSEDASVSVLLLEAGKEATSLDSKIPAAAGKLQNTDLDWGYFTESQNTNYAQGLRDKRVYYPRGKCLGGSSILNYMAYVRGCKKDFDNWEEEGAEGWSYDEVLPFFMKSEEMQDWSHIERAPITDSVHGNSGPLTVSVKEPVNKIAHCFVDSCVALGYERGDYNDGNQDNKVSLFQTTVRNGERCDTATAFLRTASRRENLTIAIESQVTKILLSESRSEAVGVEVNQKYQIFAKKEVVLSAGAIGSPHIMLLSGIGPKAELEEVGVTCLRDMPEVGKNMEDHIALVLRYTSKKNKDIGSINTKKVEQLPGALSSLYDFMVKGSGNLTSSCYDATMFCYSKNPPVDPGPNVQIGMFCTPGNEDLFEKNLKYEENYFLKQDQLRADSEGFIFVPTLLHPRSRGKVQLKSSDPFAAPLIEPNYLDNKEDVENFIEAIEKCKEIAGTAPLNKLIEDEPILPDTLVRVHGSCDSASFWEDFVRNYANTLYHPTSTLKIGKVVNENLQVYGIPNLRIVDASIMPHVTSGNTNAPSIMIGEKGADIIVRHHGLQPAKHSYSQKKWFSFL